MEQLCGLNELIISVPNSEIALTINPSSLTNQRMKLYAYPDILQDGDIIAYTVGSFTVNGVTPTSIPKTSYTIPVNRIYFTTNIANCSIVEGQDTLDYLSLPAGNYMVELSFQIRIFSYTFSGDTITAYNNYFGTFNPNNYIMYTIPSSNSHVANISLVNDFGDTISNIISLDSLTCTFNSQMNGNYSYDSYTFLISLDEQTNILPQIDFFDIIMELTRNTGQLPASPFTITNLYPGLSIIASKLKVTKL